MSISNLSAAATDTLHSCGRTALTLIDAYRAGGSRVLGGVDAGWESLVSRRGARLSQQLRSDLIAAQREVTGHIAKGVEALGSKSASIVKSVVDAATAGVERLSGRVDNLEAVLTPLPLGSAIVIVQPFAEAGREVAGLVAERAARALSRADADVGKVKDAPVKRAPAARRG